MLKKNVMKNLLLSFALLISSLGWTQNTSDVITLKNGSVIIGKITEFNYNSNVSIQTQDGYNFTFRANDLKSVKKLPATNEPTNTPIPNQNYTNSNSNQGITSSTNQFTNTQPAVNQGIPSGTNTWGQRPYNPNIQSNLQSQQLPNSNQQFAANTKPNTYAQNYPNTNTYQQSQTYPNTQPTQNFQNPQGVQNFGAQHQNQPSHVLPPNPAQQNVRPQYGNGGNIYANQNPSNNYVAPQGYTQNQFVTTPVPDPTLTPTPKAVQNSDIFTNVDNYGSITKTAPVDCSRGFGNYGFVNKTGRDIIVSLQKQQSDGVYGDFKEISIIAGSRGYFNNMKTESYPFFIKQKSLVGNNRNDYVILGRGKIKIEKCKTTFIEIK